jgi:hypothetical protein
MVWKVVVGILPAAATEATVANLKRLDAAHNACPWPKIFHRGVFVGEVPGPPNTGSHLKASNVPPKQCRIVPCLTLIVNPPSTHNCVSMPYLMMTAGLKCIMPGSANKGGARGSQEEPGRARGARRSRRRPVILISLEKIHSLIGWEEVGQGRPAKPAIATHFPQNAK